MTTFPAALAEHLDAIHARDLDRYLATVHDDVTLVLPNGMQHVGRDAVAEFHREMFADPDWTQTFRHLRTTRADAVASAVHDVDYRDVRPDGSPYRSRFVLTLVFVHEAGRWLLLHDQCTPLSEATDGQDHG